MAREGTLSRKTCPLRRRLLEAAETFLLLMPNGLLVTIPYS